MIADLVKAETERKEDPKKPLLDRSLEELEPELDKIDKLTNDIAAILDPVDSTQSTVSTHDRITFRYRRDKLNVAHARRLHHPLQIFQFVMKKVSFGQIYALFDREEERRLRIDRLEK